MNQMCASNAKDKLGANMFTEWRPGRENRKKKLS